MEQREESDSGLFNHAMVFYSVLVGLVAVTFLENWGKMILNSEQIILYPLHIYWTVFLFFFLVFDWWCVWQIRSIISPRFHFYFFSILIPIVFYFICIFFFPAIPDDFKTVINMRDHYYKNHTIIFALAAAMFLLATISGFFADDEALLNKLGFNKGCATFVRLFGVSMIIILACSDEAWLHCALSAITLLILIPFVYIYNSVNGD